MDFRLATGTPQYVTYKSHPYQHVEILEWRRRIDVTKALYGGQMMNCDDLKRAALQDRLTHVLTTAGDPSVSCSFAKEIFNEKDTHIFQLELARRDPSLN